MQVSTFAVDLLQLAANYSYGSYVQSLQGTDAAVQLVSYDNRFTQMMGKNVSATIADQHDWQFVHEAGVYLPATKSIYAVSQSSTEQDPINVTVIDAATYKMTASYRVPGMPMPNGGTKYNDTHVLFCVFGDEVYPSTLTLFEPQAKRATVLLSSFYGRNFSSINDVRLHPDGSIWFTDDYYGDYEGFKPVPAMPAQVHRLDPRTGVLRAVADGFDQSNGLEFSADYKTLYVADSGYVHQPGNFNGTRPNSIYAFDVMPDGGLANRRLFAYSSNPFVDGMHVDRQGYVWSSSGKGVTAWDQHGVMLGEVRLSTNINNFMLVPDGLLLFGFEKLWHVRSGARPRKSDAF